MISVFFLVLAAALPLMLWLGTVARQRLVFLFLPEAGSIASSPPVYLLSQRFRV